MQAANSANSVKNIGKITILAITPLLLSFQSFAAVQPAPYVFENGLAATPIVTLGVSHDDNISSLSDDSNKISSFVYTVEPSINVAGEFRNHTFYSTLGASLGQFTSSHEDDYLDYYALAGSTINLGIRHKVDIDLGYGHEHESRGEGLSEGLGNQLTDPIEYDRETANGKYTYGADDAKGQLALSAGYENVTYTNYRNLTGINAARSSRFKDYDSIELAGELRVKTNRAFNTVFEIKNTETRYPFSSGQDNHLTLYYVGANWDVTGKTSGFAKIGMQDKRFENSSADFSSLSWNVGFTWSPTDYAIIGLDTSKIAEDPSAISGYNDTTKYGVYWQHAWMDRFSTRASYRFNDEDYNKGSRLDKTHTYGISANYDFRRWMSLSFGVDITDKESTQSGVGYDQTVFFSALTISL